MCKDLHWWQSRGLDACLVSRSGGAGSGRGVASALGKDALPDLPGDDGECDACGVLEKIGPVVPITDVIEEGGNEFGEDGDRKGELPLPALSGDEQNEKGESGVGADVKEPESLR
jgi:hypothetical protein